MISLQDSVDQLLTKTLKKKHKLLPPILMHWEDIIGAQYSKICWPQRIGYFYEKKQKHLTLYLAAADSATAMRVSFLHDLIVERLACYLGQKTISKVKVSASFLHARAGYRESN